MLLFVISSRAILPAVLKRAKCVVLDARTDRDRRKLLSVGSERAESSPPNESPAAPEVAKHHRDGTSYTVPGRISGEPLTCAADSTPNGSPWVTVIDHPSSLFPHRQ